ncbi:conserved hypothetical protein [Culex quinquefasciatus]|uniref:Uncharacterized protein n=1 Tax=Culex quinquefasciatus TaxID=7176 RepID=B0XLJ8_CULQU|nr:conserved hypothetical protein [Culex quinquefasciatus]|eukprot:XP_001870520.1 conserved hypothetical protein [Culex quinquefasciatus]
MGRHGHRQKLRHIELHGQQQQRFDRQPTKTPTSRRSLQRTTTTVADLLRFCKESTLREIAFDKVRMVMDMNLMVVMIARTRSNVT